jgi:hypothetical protein
LTIFTLYTEKYYKCEFLIIKSQKYEFKFIEIDNFFPKNPNLFVLQLYTRLISEYFFLHKNRLGPLFGSVKIIRGDQGNFYEEKIFTNFF